VDCKSGNIWEIVQDNGVITTNTNRKGRDCPIAPFPMTLSDLYGSTHLLQASSYSYTAADKMSTDRASRRPSMIAQPLVQRFVRHYNLWR